LDDGSKPPDKKYFEPDCHFHEKTRTFHGTLRWDENKNNCRRRVRGSHQWDYVLAFSADYRYIVRGILIARKQICSNLMDCPHYDCKFPFDGRWQASWPGSQKPSTQVHVHGNQLRFPTSDLVVLDFADPELPVLVWSARQEERHSVTLGANLRTHSKGPGVGECIEWEAPSSTQPRMIWTRETVASESVPLQVVHFGPDHPSKTFYHSLLPGSEQQQVPEYVPDTIWGNSFCQALTVGLASYHFLSDQSGAYISYEHEQTSVWPPLDNGCPIPSRIAFSEFSFDAETRVFRGKIDWERTHETTWQGCRWWR
jgi:hypothetical protein